MDQATADASARLSAVLSAVGTRAVDWTRPLPTTMVLEDQDQPIADFSDEYLIELAASAVGVLLDRMEERA